MSTTATVVASPAEKPVSRDYKDFATTDVDSNVELHGTQKSAPASFPNYLPVWDNEKGKKYGLWLQRFCFFLDLRMKIFRNAKTSGYTSGYTDADPCLVDADILP